MATALAQSCDTYFYELGRRFYDLPPDRRHPFQEWAARFGFGQTTGIDVGAEERGLAADARVAQADVHEEDRPARLADRPRSGSRATRSSSRSARRTCS